jgi:hypothetical protein
MTALPRDRCPHCSGWVPVRKNGTLREHRQIGSLLDNTLICPASGERPDFEVPGVVEPTQAEREQWQGSDL